MAAAIHKNVKGNIKAHTALSICRAYSPTLAHPPALRLPGLLHYREGFIPLTVAPTAGQPIRRMLPWSTCGHTQGLVRIAPAKQYRLQLHVTTNVKHQRPGAGKC